MLYCWVLRRRGYLGAPEKTATRFFTNPMPMLASSHDGVARATLAVPWLLDAAVRCYDTGDRGIAHTSVHYLLHGYQHTNGIEHIAKGLAQMHAPSLSPPSWIVSQFLRSLCFQQAYGKKATPRQKTVQDLVSS